MSKRDALDSKGQILLQARVIRIWRQVNMIKGCITPRQLHRISFPLNFEAQPSIWALFILKAIDRNPRGTRSEPQ
jgi:hypothetical protein